MQSANPRVRFGMRVLAVVFLIGLLVLTVAVTSKDDTTNTETALWTFILFASGVGISFYFGQQSIKNGANELVRPQARGAARRLVTLGRGLALLRDAIERQRHAALQHALEDQAGEVPIEHVELAYDMLLVQINGQQQTVIDALEDWREFEPEIVNELQASTPEVARQNEWDFPAEDSS